jgi:hypothetical protein
MRARVMRRGATARLALLPEREQGPIAIGAAAVGDSVQDAFHGGQTACRVRAIRAIRLAAKGVEHVEREYRPATITVKATAAPALCGRSVQHAVHVNEAADGARTVQARLPLDAKRMENLLRVCGGVGRSRRTTEPCMQLLPEPAGRMRSQPTPQTGRWIRLSFLSLPIVLPSNRRCQDSSSTILRQEIPCRKLQILRNLLKPNQKCHSRRAAFARRGKGTQAPTSPRTSAPWHGLGPLPSRPAYKAASRTIVPVDISKPLYRRGARRG